MIRQVVRLLGQNVLRHALVTLLVLSTGFISMQLEPDRIDHDSSTAVECFDKTTGTISTQAHTCPGQRPLYGGCKEWRPDYGPKPRRCRR